jgi:hypothetical protein
MPKTNTTDSFLILELGSWNGMVLSVAHGIIAISTKFMLVLLLRPVHSSTFLRYIASFALSCRGTLKYISGRLQVRQGYLRCIDRS